MRSVNEQWRKLYKYVHMLTVSIDISRTLYKWGISYNLHMGCQCVQFSIRMYKWGMRGNLRLEIPHTIKIVSDVHQYS